MSRCISSHGEYGEHTLPDPKAAGMADDRFVCTRCFAFDEDAAMDALRKAEAIAEAARAYVAAVERAEWMQECGGYAKEAHADAESEILRTGQALNAAVDAERAGREGDR